MRLQLIGIGRTKAGAERELTARYLERAGQAGRAIGFPSVELREIEESRARRGDERKAQEGKAIRALLQPASLIVAFDEHGRSIDSEGFADCLGQARDSGKAMMHFLIGGADGLEPALTESAAFVFAFGKMTWPHQLVRIMAAEQIYRAMTILGHHPYHRA
ncbi:23S rRNA (pseudouridine(1915)-N(3))-methyltransferase RlmH [Beijerinckia indica]|uniref:Ribosomal RNA large subunit methyltransferase H n=1 Tax=Beijerinckia indica subsp. indica (strain ATCC 9039 / DSM 1715 / NCIMB 8712) TaxID=395963 RepID=RLMH_BEII9|nr:23S rRNA (pseudouridine(1915)-N(3))-methyltransferase RlmH [Beijerinckia indica]B2IKW1.2 RecName: Full=Ribosomal RNA large subunit methyltransferase H; AltName: Full=23S rRNA (pseudouridine1915-N3)-methyltransferase; AltName: Full=23S rRNA m3Psi1915 methyltransferase; AltName: Full=rRNA (pseudouridine-N3-)-methyltransferase RlmH [Beijerinckia indica subsp. indica ATCC 9039]